MSEETRVSKSGSPMTDPEQSNVGHAEGYTVWAKQGGWEWNAYVQGNRRIGAARSERGAINHAQRALAEMRREMDSRS